jgi:hypothetical protein
VTVELAIAEQQRRLHDRLAELELRVDLLAKVVAGLTGGHLDRPQLTGVMCGTCGADRLAEGCRLRDRTRCLFTGEAQ